MILCSDCYDKLKDIPNIEKTGRGISCFGGYRICEECNKKISSYIQAEVSNKRLEKAVIETVERVFSRKRNGN